MLPLHRPQDIVYTPFGRQYHGWLPHLYAPGHYVIDDFGNSVRVR
jgi:hypothetical protein